MSESETASSSIDDVLTEARDWLEQGRKVAVATVVETWGSSPRPVGSQLAVDDQYAVTVLRIERIGQRRVFPTLRCGPA